MRSLVWGKRREGKREVYKRREPHVIVMSPEQPSNLNTRHADSKENVLPNLDQQVILFLALHHPGLSG